MTASPSGNFGQTREIPARAEPIRIDLARTVLVVIDVQNAFLSKGGLVGFDVSTAPTVIAAIARVTVACRAAGLEVVYVQNGFSPAIREATLATSPLFHKSNALKFMRENPAYHSKLITEGTWDYDIVSELMPAPDDTVVKKARYSAFESTAFDQFLRARGITTLIVVGVNTRVCVEPTVRAAYHREYFAAMVPEATLPTGVRPIFNATVFNVEHFFGWTMSV